jgi:hypothetical protein
MISVSCVVSGTDNSPAITGCTDVDKSNLYGFCLIRPGPNQAKHSMIALRVPEAYPRGGSRRIDRFEIRLGPVASPAQPS